jgi:hypothetical protein
VVLHELHGFISQVGSSRPVCSLQSQLQIQDATKMFTGFLYIPAAGNAILPQTACCVKERLIQEMFI